MGEQFQQLGDQVESRPRAGLQSFSRRRKGGMSQCTLSWCLLIPPHLSHGAARMTLPHPGHTTWVYVGDVGPMLLPESIEKDEKPAHDPIEVCVDTTSLGASTATFRSD